MRKEAAREGLIDDSHVRGSFDVGAREIAPGKQPYSIFLATEASPSERWAAEELSQHIEQMTGR